MNKSLIIFIVLIIFFCSSVTFSETIYSKEQKDAVEKILRDKNRRDESKTPWQEHAEDSKFLGDDALAILASFLTDYDLGYDALETMLAIDSSKAAPFIFASMPQSDLNVQYNAFRYFRRQIQNHQPIIFVKEIHDAAVRCVEANTNVDAAEEALWAIGLTGSKKDFPMLEKYYNNKPPTDVWKVKLRNASEAALARLGHKDYIIKIIDELKSPVSAVLTLEKGIEISNLIKKAAFSANESFIPLLCKHLNDPYVREYDFGVGPAYDAAQALNQLINKVSPDSITASIESWKEKCIGLDHQ